MPQTVGAEPGQFGFLAGMAPGRSPIRNGFGRIDVAMLAGGEYILIRPANRKPAGPHVEHSASRLREQHNATGADLSLRIPYPQHTRLQVDLLPFRAANFRMSHTRIQLENCDRVYHHRNE